MPLSPCAVPGSHTHNHCQWALLLPLWCIPLVCGKRCVATGDSILVSHHCITGTLMGGLSRGCGGNAAHWLRDGSLAVGGGSKAVVLLDSDGMGQMRTPTHNFLPLLLPQCCRELHCRCGPSWPCPCCGCCCILFMYWGCHLFWHPIFQCRHLHMPGAHQAMMPNILKVLQLFCIALCSDSGQINRRVRTCMNGM